MISDVLSDAAADIEDYRRDFPDTYGEFTAEIDVVKTVMDGLRIVFDASPGLGDEHDKLIAELRSAIRAVDGSNSSRSIRGSTGFSARSARYSMARTVVLPPATNRRPYWPLGPSNKSEPVASV